jgi:hypothetical protein
MGVAVEALQPVALCWRAQQQILRQDVNHNSSMPAVERGMPVVRARGHRSPEEEEP